MTGAMTAWQSMSPAEKRGEVKALLEAGETYDAIAARLGASSRSSVASVVTQLRDKGILAPSKKTLGVRSSRKRGGITGGKPSLTRIKQLREAKESQAKSEEVGAHGGARSVPTADAESRPVAGRSATATSERMGATVVGDESGTLKISSAAAFDPIPGVEPIRLTEFGPRTCKWPVDGLHGREYLFCGAECDFEHSYCEAHRALSYTPPTYRLSAPKGA